MGRKVTAKVAGDQGSVQWASKNDSGDSAGAAALQNSRSMQLSRWRFNGSCSTAVISQHAAQPLAIQWELQHSSRLAADGIPQI